MFGAVVREYSSTAMPPFLAISTPAFLQSELGDVRHAAGREHDAVGGNVIAARRAAPNNARRAFSIAATGAAGDHPDAALLHLDAQVLAHVVVEAAQNILAAIDQRHVRAETGKDAGELDRDVAAALDHHAARQFRQMKRLVRR